jgi:hypothetical protein
MSTITIKPRPPVIKRNAAVKPTIGLFAKHARLFEKELIPAFQKALTEWNIA